MQEKQTCSSRTYNGPFRERARSKLEGEEKRCRLVDTSLGDLGLCLLQQLHILCNARVLDVAVERAEGGADFLRGPRGDGDT